MISARRLTITAAFIAAYWDLNRVLQRLRRPALIAYGVLVANVFAAAIIPPLMTYNRLGRLLIELLVNIAGAFFTVPFLLAAHRFVLLDEPAPFHYRVEPGEPRFQLFFGWLVVITLLVSLPSYLALATTPASPVYYISRPPAANLTQLAALVAIVIAICVFVIRLAILLPAIAVDAPGVTWQNALKDTRGHFWFIVIASAVPFIPILLLGWGMKFVLGLLPGPGLALIVGGLVGMAFIFVGTILAVVVLSRLYQALGNRVNEPLPASS